MDKFLKEYHNKPVADDGGYMSEEARSFFRKMKNYIKRCMPNYAISKWSVGHYDVSFFLLAKDSFDAQQGFTEKPIYVSYSLPRGCVHVDVFKSDPIFGVLYRRTKDLNDYTGETNHFCSLADFSDSFRNSYIFRRKEMKKQYKITHTETWEDSFYVEAESESDAIDVFNQMVNNGEIDLGHVEMVDSSDVAALCEEDKEEL